MENNPENNLEINNLEINSESKLDAKPANKFSRIKISILIFFLIITAYYLILSVMAPVKAFKEIQKTYTTDDSILIALTQSDQKADSLALVNANINSRIVTAGLDSINFLLNIKDSTLALELEGVAIHQIKISKIRYSRILSKMGTECSYLYLSTPFYVKRYEATIPKVPIVVKQAPRDTAEANQMNTVPQIPPEDYVKLSFELNKHLNLLVNQSEPPADHHKSNAFFIRVYDQLTYVRNIVRSGIHLKVPDYTPWIYIEIPGDDAKTLLRALPENAAMVLIL